MAAPTYRDDTHLRWFEQKLQDAEDRVFKLKSLTREERLVLSKWFDVPRKDGHARALNLLAAFETIIEK